MTFDSSNRRTQGSFKRTPRRWAFRFVAGSLILVGAVGALDLKSRADSSASINQGDIRLPPIVEGQRRIDFLRTFSSPKDFRKQRSFLKRVLDFVAGPPEIPRLVRPYSIATDSRGRVLITDPGSQTVQIFDFEQKKHQRLRGSRREPFASPIGVAVDGQDNIYVTDSRLGKIFVFDPKGKFTRYIGDLKCEGRFKRPTGIAIDAKAGEIYLTDTLYHAVFVMDLSGKILRRFGERGTENGQFNYPTGVALHGEELIVVDAMNFRLQAFDRHGQFRRAFGVVGNSTGAFYRPKGVAVDSEGNIYVVENLFETVQVFDDQGRLLYFFGASGGEPGQFQLPSGIWIDPRDRIYIADSYNHRVQEFQFVNRQRYLESLKTANSDEGTR